MEEKKEAVKIEDLNSDSSLSLLALMGDKQAEVPIKLCELSVPEVEEINNRIRCPFVALDVIVQEYEKKFQVVSFQHSKAEIDLIAIHNDGIYKWPRVMVDRIQLSSGRMVHVVKCNKSAGEKFNRRRGVRIDLDQAMELEQGGMTYQVVVRDISYCGVGLLERGESKLNDVEPFVLQLTERNSKGENIIVGKISGKIVRRETTENGDTISGAIVAKNHYSFLQKFIAIKQMEQLNGGSARGVQRGVEGEMWKHVTAKQLGQSQ